MASANPLSVLLAGPGAHALPVAPSTRSVGADLKTLFVTAGGTLWSVLYFRYRQLWPLAVSHALVGTTFYYWVYGHDLASRWSAFLRSLSN
jgi:hypothetical protein